MNILNQLSDIASIHVHPISPALNTQQNVELTEALHALLQEFVTEGVVRAATAEVCLDGSAVVIAYDNCENDSCGGDDLSGCRKSKITAVLTAYEHSSGVAIISAPPMLICEQGEGQGQGAWRCFDRGTLKPQVQAGSINEESLACNTRCENLGQWRAHQILPVKNMWLLPIIRRMQSA